MPTSLVTGGAGFIGSHLVRRLLTEGHAVRVLDNLSTGHRDNLGDDLDRVTFLEGSVVDSAIVAEAVAGVDVVFHEAALASVPLSVERPLDAHDACATGTLTVLDAARRAGVKRVVYAASSSAYGDRPEQPKAESHVPEAVSPYAAAKLTGELYCEAFAHTYGLETVRLRYFNVFGPRQDPKSPYSAVIPLFVSALLEGRRPRIFGDGRQTRDFVHVDNVVQANLLAATTPGVSGRVYNVGTGVPITVVGLLKSICDVVQIPFDPEFLPPRTGDVRDSTADITAIARDLGYEVTTNLEDGLRQTIASYTTTS